MDFEKFGLNFSNRSFVIRFNLLHPSPSWPYLHLFLSLWLLSCLTNCYSTNFLLLKYIFCVSNNDPKYGDRAALKNEPHLPVTHSSDILRDLTLRLKRDTQMRWHDYILEKVISLLTVKESRYIFFQDKPRKGITFILEAR